MPTMLNPYLGFRDTAREAMEFYQSVFGGELMLSTFAEMHASEDPAEQDKIMHGMLTSPSGLVLMGADTPNSMDYTPGDNFSVSLSGDDEAELRGYWDELPTVRRSPCRSTRRRGATPSACAPTSSGSAGWSTSPGRRPEARWTRERPTCPVAPIRSGGANQAGEQASGEPPVAQSQPNQVVEDRLAGPAARVPASISRGARTSLAARSVDRRWAPSRRAHQRPVPAPALRRRTRGARPAIRRTRPHRRFLPRSAG